MKTPHASGGEATLVRWPCHQLSLSGFQRSGNPAVPDPSQLLASAAAAGTNFPIDTPGGMPQANGSQQKHAPAHAEMNTGKPNTFIARLSQQAGICF